MTNPFRDNAQRDEFLTQPRLAILITNDDPGVPIGVPVWFEWTGTKVQMFAGKETPKIDRIKRDPNASVLVTNAVGEREAWVAFDGPVDVGDEGALRSPPALPIDTGIWVTNSFAPCFIRGNKRRSLFAYLRSSPREFERASKYHEASQYVQHSKLDRIKRFITKIYSL